MYVEHYNKFTNFNFLYFALKQPSCEKTEPGKNKRGQFFCGFWNETDLFWSDKGCTLTNLKDNFAQCQCNHLTNFASLFVSRL